MMAVSGMRRIVALWFPRLPTDRLRRRWAVSPPPEAGLPLVMAAKIDNAMRLTAVDRRAELLGLRPGMALASARAMVPVVTVKTADAPGDETLLSHLADWCDSFSPLVALDPPHGLLLDITGTSHLFNGETALLDRLKAALGRQGFTVTGAIAGSALAARALARFRDGMVVAEGGDREAMAGLPVEALGLDPHTTHAFRRAGLKRVGQVASRQRAELTARFGAAMVYRLDAALGEAQTPISPRLKQPPYRVQCRYAEPVASQESLLATLKDLAGHLAKSLEERGDGLRVLEAVFFRADGVIRKIRIETGAPAREPALLARLFREKLDALADPLDPGFGFDCVRLEALQVQPYREEADGLAAKVQAEQEVRQLVDRLAARFGSQRVLVFRLEDTHIPENAFRAVPAQYAEKPSLAWTRQRGPGEAPRRPLRMILPEPVTMLPGGRFFWRNAQHSIAKLEGPERIAREWWRDPGPARDYFRLEDREGRRYWLYREEGARWFLHGLFA